MDNSEILDYKHRLTNRGKSGDWNVGRLVQSRQVTAQEDEKNEFGISKRRTETTINEFTM